MGHRRHLNFGTGNDGTPRRKPVKDYRTVKRVVRRCVELTVMLESAQFEQHRLICQVEDQRKELELIQQSNHAYQGLGAQVTGITSDKQQLQLDLNEVIAAMAEAEKSASASNRKTLAAVYETAAESAARAAEAKTATAEYVLLHAKSQYQQALKLAQSPNVGAMDDGDYGKANDYMPYSFFVHINSFFRGRGKWFAHAKDLLNMKPLRHFLVGHVVILLRETVFTKKKWTQAVDMNHGFDLGGI
jgi:hypothetical protein